MKRAEKKSNVNYGLNKREAIGADITIAIRRYECTVQQYEDRMIRKADGTFVLIQSPDRPGGPEVETPYSLAGVFDWLQDTPEQIDRTVIAGSV